MRIYLVFEEVEFGLQVLLFEFPQMLVGACCEEKEPHAYIEYERKDNEPIVLAGGPCAFNPLPLSDFIDVFCIGDGEEMMVEVCEVLERTKGKCRADRKGRIYSNLLYFRGRERNADG